MDDERWMRRCVELARKGIGRVSPNPPVGAIVVSPEGKLIAEGYHAGFGEPHAEVVALDAAGDGTKGAALYVSLEPCRHEGKTPPCTDAILAAGVARVVYGAADPHPEHGGGGQLLASKGLDVTGGALAAECRELIATFLKHARTGLPLVTAKWAMSLDGKTASRTGDSKWISDEESRRAAHRMRAECDCVMIGAGTLRADDPLLTARLERGEAGRVRQPMRAVVAGALEVAPEARLFGSEGGPVVVAASEGVEAAAGKALAEKGVEVLRVRGSGGRVDLAALSAELGRRGVQSVLLEGGGELTASALEAGMVDAIAVFVAPKILGGRGAKSPVEGEGVASVAESPELSGVSVERVGSSVLLRARLGAWEWLEG